MPTKDTASSSLFVLDVSVAARWFLADEDSATANTILDCVAKEGAVAPALFRWEAQNVLLTAERHGRMQPHEVDQALAMLSHLPIRFEVVSGGFAGSEIQLARHYRLTAYDASYLALAAEHHLPLATTDRHLLRAASDLGIEIIGP